MNSSTKFTVPPGTLAFSYIRFSRISQKHGRSRLRQEEAFEKWCTDVGATPFSDSFLDQGKSGYTGEHVGPRGQLRRFLDLVETGKIPQGSYLVVESLDRLGRDNVNKAQERLLGITNAGVNVVTLLDGEKIYHAGGSAADLIMSVLVMERANEESRAKANRSRDNWAEAFAKARGPEKRPVGKQIARWLKTVELDELDERGKKKKKYDPDPERVPVVERIFRESIAGHGFVAIAQRLNADNVLAFRGGTWCASSVKELLGNRCVLGEWQPKDGGPVIEGYFPEVITPETWERAQLEMKKRRKGDYTRQTPNFQIWQQVAACAICGSSMNLVTKGAEPYRYKYLSCSNKRKGLCDGALNVRADRAEAVYKHLLVQVGALGLIQTEAAEITDAMAAVDASLHAEQTTRARHMKRLAEPDAPEFLYELVGTADQNIKRLKAEREELDAKHVAQTVAQSDKAWLLANIPLTERDERQRANALLCRLGIEVAVSGGDKPLFTAYQKNRLILKISVAGDEIQSMPYSADVAIRMLNQDELREDELYINIGFGKRRLPEPKRSEDASGAVPVIVESSNESGMVEGWAGYGYEDDRTDYGHDFPQDEEGSGEDAVSTT